MMQYSLILLLGSSLVTYGFLPRVSQTGVSKTRLFEDFNPDFKNPVIISSKEIFSEKQLREFTSAYSVDERFSFFSFFAGLLPGASKVEEKAVKEQAKPEPSFAKQLKPSVSLAVLEEKTALFVTGKSNGKVFAGVLKAAFGDKVNVVLPQILESLPKAKADELSKALK